MVRMGEPEVEHGVATAARSHLDESAQQEAQDEQNKLVNPCVADGARGENESAALEAQDGDNTVAPEEHGEEKEERSAVFETRLETADSYRVSGNDVFKNSKSPSDEEAAREALAIYEKGLYHCDFDELQYNFELMDKHREAVDKVRTPLFLNAAACELRLKRWGAAEERCSEALKYKPESAKALFRRGQAFHGAGKLEKARADLLAAAKMEPNNRMIRSLLSDIVEKCKKEKEQGQKLWKGKLEEALETRDSGGDEEPLSAATASTPGLEQPSRGFCDKLIGAVLYWFGLDNKSIKAKTS